MLRLPFRVVAYSLALCSMRRYAVTSDFTVFRQRDRAPKQLKTGFHFSAREPLANPVVLEIGSERFESDKGGFLAHTITLLSADD